MASRCRCAHWAWHYRDRQDHDLIQCAGQERDMYTAIRVSRWRGSLIHRKRLAWVPAQGLRTVL